MSIKNTILSIKEGESAERLMRGADGLLYRITPEQVIPIHKEEEIAARQTGSQAYSLVIQRAASKPAIAAVKKICALEE